MTDASLINTLNDLIEVCKDGEYGFHTCSEFTSSKALSNIFAERAQECRGAARELQVFVDEYGGKAEYGGSARGSLRRGWVAVLGTVGGSSDHRMLEAAERGEDSAVARYRKATRNGDLPPIVRATVERQMAGLQRNHDNVKVLRDRLTVSR
jgi:uncharacterized protein (TIGR02284 family)